MIYLKTTYNSKTTIRMKQRCSNLDKNMNGAFHVFICVYWSGKKTVTGEIIGA